MLALSAVAVREPYFDALEIKEGYVGGARENVSLTYEPINQIDNILAFVTYHEGGLRCEGCGGGAES